MADCWMQESKSYFLKRKEQKDGFLFANGSMC